VGGSPLNFTDPHGLYAGIDDLVFSGGGAIVGLVGQGVSDLLSGHLSSGQDYAGAVVGGAVGGEALLYTGPIGAGLAGGAATNATKQFLKNMAGKQCGYNATSFVADTAAGGLTGLIPGVRILGVTGGRGSWNAIFKQMSTKFSNGSISNVSVQTALKMAGGRAVDTAVVPGMATGSVAGTYLEPYIPGYGDSCTCRAK
jgi:type VI secretion system secreted protein VgrG